jgi:hypothetical protein
MKRTDPETMLTPVMRVNRRGTAFITCIVLSGIGANTAAADTFRQLKGREIASRFTGMELTDEVHWAYVFDRGGRLNIFSMGRPGTGSWKVDKNELCLDRPPDEPRCYEVWVSGQNVQLRREPDVPDEGILQKPQKRQ